VTRWNASVRLSRPGCSATYQALQLFRISVSLNPDLRDGFVDDAKLLGRQFDGSGSDVFL
jgi:hypothetical protein